MPQNDQKQAKWEFVGHTIKTIILLGKLNSHFDATILQISLIFTEEKDLQAKYFLADVNALIWILFPESCENGV